MNTIRLTARQRYYVEALGRNGHRLLYPLKWCAAEGELARCWNSSGWSEGVDWREVRLIARRSWYASSRAGLYESCTNIPVPGHSRRAQYSIEATIAAGNRCSSPATKCPPR